MPRQDSLYDQLKTVYELANKAQCYDAADFIRNQIEDIERRLKEAEKARNDPSYHLPMSDF